MSRQAEDNSIQDIRNLLLQPIDEAEYERSLEAVGPLVRQALRSVTAPERKPRRRRGVSRGLGVALAVVIAGSTVAAAARFDFFGNDPAAPANRVQALKDPQPTARDGGPSSAIGAFAKAPIHGDDDVAAMETFMEGAGILASPDPQGTGRLLPLRENLRLLQDLRRDNLVAQIFAVPTTSGDVCYWLWTLPTRLMAGRCTKELGPDQPITVFTSSDVTTGDTLVWGLAMNGVERVSVRLPDGTRQIADMGSNSFIWSAEQAPKPVGFEVTLHGGDAPMRLDANGRSIKGVINGGDGSTNRPHHENQLVE